MSQPSSQPAIQPASRPASQAHRRDRLHRRSLHHRQRRAASGGVGRKLGQRRQHIGGWAGLGEPHRVRARAPAARRRAAGAARRLVAEAGKGRQRKGAAGGGRQGEPHVRLLQLGLQRRPVEQQQVLVQHPVVQRGRRLRGRGSREGRGRVGLREPRRRLGVSEEGAQQCGRLGCQQCDAWHGCCRHRLQPPARHQHSMASTAARRRTDLGNLQLNSQQPAGAACRPQHCRLRCVLLAGRGCTPSSAAGACAACAGRAAAAAIAAAASLAAGAAGCAAAAATAGPHGRQLRPRVQAGFGFRVFAILPSFRRLLLLLLLLLLPLLLLAGVAARLPGWQAAAAGGEEATRRTSGMKSVGRPAPRALASSAVVRYMAYLVAGTRKRVGLAEVQAAPQCGGADGSQGGEGGGALPGEAAAPGVAWARHCHAAGSAASCLAHGLGAQSSQRLAGTGDSNGRPCWGPGRVSMGDHKLLAIEGVCSKRLGPSWPLLRSHWAAGLLYAWYSCDPDTRNASLDVDSCVAISPQPGQALLSRWQGSPPSWRPCCWPWPALPNPRARRRWPTAR